MVVNLFNKGWSFYWGKFQVKIFDNIFVLCTLIQFKQCLINRDIDTKLAKAWTATNRLLLIWKSDLTDKMKRSFVQAVVVSILLYGCTTWTLTKQMEKKLDSNYTRMLWAIFNKSWRQRPIKQQLYGHLPPITKTIKVRWTRHAGHCWRSRDKLISDVLLWTLSHGQPASTYSSSVRILGVALRTCRKWWMIGRGGGRGSGISVLMAEQDDVDCDTQYFTFWR